MIKKPTQSYLLAMSMMALSTNIMSKEISYDYVQATYSSITDSSLGVDVDGTGFAPSFSVSITPNVAFTALYGTTSFDRVLGLEIDTTEFDFGFTAHKSIAPNTDVYGNFSVVNADLEVSDGFTTASADDTGNAISVGIRHMAIGTEINLVFSRSDVFDVTSNSFGFGARFYADEEFSIAVGYNTGDDVDVLLLNARIDFK